VFLATATAQVANKPSQSAVANARKTSASQGWLNTPFDPSLEKLPPHFRGHDPRAIYLALQKVGANPTKSEYESTAEFEKRKASIGDRALFGTLKAGSTVAFVRDEYTFPMLGLISNYDADHQLLAVTLRGRKSRLYLEGLFAPEILEVVLGGKTTSSDSYIGTNAFGATREVSRSYEDQYGLALKPKKWPFEREDRFSDAESKFEIVNISSSQARQLKQNLRILFIGTLQEPWTHHDVEGREAKFDSPYESTTSKYLLDFVPKEIWFFDYSTGIVLKKIAASQAESDDNATAPTLK
jgi:hypothetical protein